ncbi:MAG: hypothetical protein IJ867_06490 [Clostridia bacterium]|nr:hypothetical protein [Clostridia bacterium]
MSDFGIVVLVFLGVMAVFWGIGVICDKIHDSKLKNTEAELKEVENKFRIVKCLYKVLLKVGVFLVIVIPYVSMSGFNSDEILSKISEEDWDEYVESVKDPYAPGKGELLRDNSGTDIYGEDVIVKKLSKKTIDYDDLDDLIDDLHDRYVEEHDTSTYQSAGWSCILIGAVIWIVYRVKMGEKEKQEIRLQKKSKWIMLAGLMVAYFASMITEEVLSGYGEWGELFYIIWIIASFVWVLQAFVDIWCELKTFGKPETRCSRCNYVIPYNKSHSYCPECRIKFKVKGEGKIEEENF